MRNSLTGEADANIKGTRSGVRLVAPKLRGYSGQSNAVLVIWE